MSAHEPFAVVDEDEESDGCIVYSVSLPDFSTIRCGVDKAECDARAAAINAAVQRERQAAFARGAEAMRAKYVAAFAHVPQVTVETLPLPEYRE